MAEVLEFADGGYRFIKGVFGRAMSVPQVVNGIPSSRRNDTAFKA